MSQQKIKYTWLELDTEYVEKIKKYYELEKQRKRLFDELKK